MYSNDSSARRRDSSGFGLGLRSRPDSLLPLAPASFNPPTFSLVGFFSLLGFRSPAGSSPRSSIEVTTSGFPFELSASGFPSALSDSGWLSALASNGSPFPPAPFAFPLCFGRRSPRLLIRLDSERGGQPTRRAVSTVPCSSSRACSSWSSGHWYFALRAIRLRLPRRMVLTAACDCVPSRQIGGRPQRDPRLVGQSDHSLATAEHASRQRRSCVPGAHHEAHHGPEAERAGRANEVQPRDARLETGAHRRVAAGHFEVPNQ